MNTLTADRNIEAGTETVTAGPMVAAVGAMAAAGEDMVAAGQASTAADAVGHATGTELACHWCSSGDGGGAAGAAHPVAEEGGSRLVVPRRHVANLTELPVHEMAAVLATLSAESSALRSAGGECQVEIDARADAAGHLVIRLTPCQAGTAHDKESGPFASLVTALAD